MYHIYKMMIVHEKCEWGGMTQSKKKKSERIKKVKTEWVCGCGVQLQQQIKEVWYHCFVYESFCFCNGTHTHHFLWFFYFWVHFHLFSTFLLSIIPQIYLSNRYFHLPKLLLHLINAITPIIIIIIMVFIYPP